MRRWIDLDKLLISINVVFDSKTAKKVCEYLDSYIAVEEDPIWIPVEKELPPCGEIVHVTVKRGYVEAGYYDDIREEWWKADDDGLLDVVAWQPVPEPYQSQIQYKTLHCAECYEGEIVKDADLGYVVRCRRDDTYHAGDDTCTFEN